jgi:hypothetical protein
MVGNTWIKIYCHPEKSIVMKKEFRFAIAGTGMISATHFEQLSSIFKFIKEGWWYLNNGGIKKGWLLL